MDAILSEIRAERAVVPVELYCEGPLLVVEGPTSLAAMHRLDYDVARSLRRYASTVKVVTPVGARDARDWGRG